jgi:uncharacterized Fe-S cluster-containing radical SAM superfamily protein
MPKKGIFTRQKGVFVRIKGVDGILQKEHTKIIDLITGQLLF